MQDVMIDLETLGTTPGSRILSIGACFFNREGASKDERFYAVLRQSDQIKKNMTTDPGTIAWWNQQTDRAKEVLEDAHSQDESWEVAEALGLFTRFLNESSSSELVRVWGNGAGFDNVLLWELYHRFDLVAPWKFYNDRCYRTLKNVFHWVPKLASEVSHHALEDAVAQAEHAAAIFRAVDMAEKL